MSTLSEMLEMLKLLFSCLSRCTTGEKGNNLDYLIIQSENGKYIFASNSTFTFNAKLLYHVE